MGAGGADADFGRVTTLADAVGDRRALTLIEVRTIGVSDECGRRDGAGIDDRRKAGLPEE